MSVYPHFSSINDAANPTGPAPMMTADFFCSAFPCPMTVTGDVVDDMMLAILARNNNELINARETVINIEIQLSRMRRCTVLLCKALFLEELDFTTNHVAGARNHTVQSMTTMS